MLSRPMVRLAGGEQPAQAGYRLLSGLQNYALSGDNVNIPVAGIIAGIISRTATGNTADVLPAADAIVAALPELSVGDSLEFSIRMTTAHTNTLSLGTGLVSAGTVNIVASNIRTYLLTLLSGANRTAVYAGSTDNTLADPNKKLLFNLPANVVKNLSIGMGVTGSGIPASSYITAINVTNNTVYINADTTAKADNVAFTFFPRFELLGLRTSAI